MNRKLPTKFKAYITKYALTSGITEIDAEDCFDVSPTMIRQDGADYGTYYQNTDWHRTMSDAIARAEAMRIKKIARLKKQIETMEKLTFGAPK